MIVLEGPLGAGKSVLARAIARGAGVSAPMPSPTFNLLLSYSARDAELLHLDLFRLREPDDVWELGWADLESSDRLVLIEWGSKAAELLPPDRWEIQLEPTSDPALRRIRAVPHGDPRALPALPRPRNAPIEQSPASTSVDGPAAGS